MGEHSMPTHPGKILGFELHVALIGKLLKCVNSEGFTGKALYNFTSWGIGDVESTQKIEHRSGGTVCYGCGAANVDRVCTVFPGASARV